KPEEALRAFERFRDVLPNDPGCHFKIGMLQAALGRLDDGRKSILRANALGGIAPEALAEAYRDLAAAYVAQRDYETGSQVGRVVVSLTGAAEDDLNLGVLEYGAGRKEEGIRIYGRIAAREDIDSVMSARVRNYLGLALLGAGRKAEAEAAFRRSIEAGET